MAVLGLGVAVLAAILYYASTVDGRGPTVVGISLTQHLSGNAEQALTTTSIEVAFSEPVQHASAQGSFTITPAVHGAFSWSGASLTFTPADRLPLRTEFEVSIGPGVRDAAGNAISGAPERFGFTTVGNPTVVGSDPADAAADLPLDAPIVVTFSTLMDTASVEAAISVSPDAQMTLRWSRERLTIVPVAGWEANQSYSLTIGVAAQDQAGTPLEHPFRLSFRTVSAGLTVETIVPADAVAGIAVTSPIAIIFDQPLDPRSVNGDLLTVTPTVAGSLDVVAPSGASGLSDTRRRILRFQPSDQLDPNTTYQVTLGPGLLGADGTGMPAGMSWSFTTGAPTETLSNQVVFLADRSGIANLWAMNPDGSNQRQLSVELSPITSYAIAPDGRAFLTGDGATVVWQRVDGTARRVLTDPGVVEFDAAYSPGGTLITFGRADPALGSSLGLWMRDADGSDPRPFQLPSPALGSPSPSQSAPVPLLRAPRLSPDGTALAFVDEAGSVDILDLELRQLATAPFVALSEPIWLADGSGVLVAGLPAASGTASSPYRPHSAVAALDPAAAELATSQVAALRVVRMDRLATSVRATAFGAGASRPAVDASGRYAFIRLEGSETAGGSLWVASSLNDPGQAIEVPATGSGSAAFAPEPGSMVIGEQDQAGVWLLSLGSRQGQQLIADGWQPSWLP
jgi:hypothetical protein